MSIRFCCKSDAAICYGDSVSQRRPAFFRGRHFDDVVIVLRVRWNRKLAGTESILAEGVAFRFGGVVGTICGDIGSVSGFSRGGSWAMQFLS
jgi:hypothetical protein